LSLPDTATSHCANLLPSTRNEASLALPKNNTDTHPPPAKAFLEALCCSDKRGTNARAMLETIEQSLMVTFGISKVAMAPPHVEHGWVASLGQPLAPPIAELRSKSLPCTRRNKPLAGPVTEIAPPLAALQLTNLHRNTTTLLPVALTAPPLALGLAHRRKMISIMVTVELTMLKAAPVFSGRSLQLKTVEDAVPLMTSDATLMMLTVGSLKTPAASEMLEALATSTAYASVLQGG
jgi:hypothetical protein